MSDGPLKLVLNQAYTAVPAAPGIIGAAFNPPHTATKMFFLVRASDAGTLALDYYDRANAAWVEFFTQATVAETGSNPVLGDVVVVDAAFEVRPRWTPGATNGTVVITAGHNGSTY